VVVLVAVAEGVMMEVEEVLAATAARVIGLALAVTQILRGGTNARDARLQNLMVAENPIVEEELIEDKAAEMAEEAVEAVENRDREIGIAPLVATQIFRGGMSASETRWHNLS